MSRTTQVPSGDWQGFRLRGCHPLRPGFPAGSANLASSRCRRSFNPGPAVTGAGLGCCAFARHYLRNHCCFLFLRVLRCFSSPGWPRAWRGAAVARGGLPHSEIRAWAGICPWARLIAACHVLLRLREPRHPSCALFSFPCVFRPAESRLPFPYPGPVEPDSGILVELPRRLSRRRRARLS